MVRPGSSAQHNLRRPFMNRLLRARRSLFAAIAASLIASAALPALAQTPPAATAPAATPEPPKWPDFNTVVKDMTPMPGLFTIYRYKAEDNSKDPTRLLCQIPRSLLKQALLL